MNRNLSSLEYMGLEYLLYKLVKSNADREFSNALNIQSITKRTHNGIQFTGTSSKFYMIGAYFIRGIFLQDETTILLAYRLMAGNEKTAEYDVPIYIDMDEFMGMEDFDRDYLMEKLEEHR